MGRIIPESEIDRVMQYGIFASREEARRSLETCDDKWTQLLIYEIKHVYRMDSFFAPARRSPFVITSSGTWRRKIQSGGLAHVN
jgi:hypothetical protein